MRFVLDNQGSKSLLQQGVTFLRTGLHVLELPETDLKTSETPSICDVSLPPPPGGWAPPRNFLYAGALVVE
jgi:hypothetical protein